MTTTNHRNSELTGPQPRGTGAIFSPRSIAVVGATEAEGSVGRAVMENLSAFPGPVYPINPKRPTVLGLPACKSLSAVPGPIDLAVIVTPAVSVPGIVRECADLNVPGAVIISAGFKECGAAGADLERRVLEEARRTHMRIIGPNCLGVMMPHARLNATFAAATARPGNVAFISQSGALCTAILDWSFRENVGFSAFVSIGSMLDVGWGDLIYHFGDDPNTKSIVCYMESVGDARRFLSAAREVALNKPIIVIKVGRSEAAAKAAASHTGSLTGSDEVLDAAFRRVGVLRVDTISQLFNMAEVLAKQPRPRGPRLAIITNAGGPGALSTDMLVAGGGQLAEISEATKNELNALLPGPWSHGNPVDILGDADADRYARTVEIVSRDPGNDGLLVILTPQKMTESTATADRLQKHAQVDGKPLLASWMGGPEVAVGEELLNHAHIPTFPYPDSAARAFTLMWGYSENLRAIYETSDPARDDTSPADTAAGRAAATALLTTVRQSGRTILTEFESKQLLVAHGIPTVETRIARTEDEAVRHAEELGLPVVLKLYSETITHKTDVGGVQLNIRTVGGVRHSWQSIEKAVTEKVGHEHFLGCTVQRMIPLDGYELILGSSVDPQFGPVLLFGTGGQLVEVFKDRALGLPPLTATLARRMMEQTKIYTALKGVRGRASVDLGALERLLVRFSQLVVEHPEIAEIDINPLLASPERLIALDARVVLQPLSVPDAQLPRPAIRPYPSQYISRWKSHAGDSIIVRPIRPEDEPLLVQFHSTVSERSVYYRYFTPLRLEQRIAHERLSRLCFIDYDREIALVAEQADATNGDRRILGVARLEKLHESTDAEFGIIISDAWQRRGLGTHLLQSLVQVARDEGIGRILATILPDNHEMQKLAHKCGFTLRHEPGASEWTAELKI